MSAKQPDPEDRRIGKLLRARRLVLAMSQSELGANVGVSFQQIQKYEQGINRVGAGRLTRLSAALGVPPAYFFPDPTSLSSPASGSHGEVLLDRKNLRALVAYSLIGDEALRDALLDLVENAARRFPKHAVQANGGNDLGKTPG